MKAVELSGVRFRYRGADRDALKGIDFHAEPGEKVAVLGLTGAGKSTLLRCLNRLVPASVKGGFEGRARLLGEDIADKKPAELADRIGMVFQDFESQLFCTTAEQEAAFGPENLGLETAEIRERIQEALAAVGMEDCRRRSPHTLSGGQKQRLAIASVLSLHPKVLALDEPVTDLDPQGRQEVARLVTRLAQAGRTLIIAEHEMELIACADRIVGLIAGEKAIDRPAQEVLNDETLTASLGARPPDRVRIFSGLGLSERPRDAGEALETLRRKGLRLSAPAGPDARAKPEPGARLIKIDRLSHRYPGQVEAVKEVSLEVRSGEFIALLGQNGSGKTTLVKHLNGLLKPTAGAVEIEGRDTRELEAAELGRRIGFVFQDPDHQIFAARVFDEVAFAPRNHGLPESEVQERVRDALEAVGLVGIEDQDPFLLTKGERQRVALASVLSARPELIVMDEPTTGLDYPAQRAVMELLKRLNQAGASVIVITHAVWVAAEYARRCLLMSGGELIADLPTRQALADPGRLSRAGLIAPEVMTMSLGLGAPLLSVEEFLAAARASGEGR